MVAPIRLLQYYKIIQAILTVAPKGLPNHSCLRETVRIFYRESAQLHRPLVVSTRAKSARSRAEHRVLAGDLAELARRLTLELVGWFVQLSALSARILDDEHGIRRGLQRHSKTMKFLNTVSDKIRIMCGHVPMVSPCL